MSVDTASDEEMDEDDNPEGQMDNGHLPLVSLDSSSGENESVPEATDQFDIELPTWHRYLGKLNNVGTSQPYDDREIATLAAIQTNTLVFPGYVLPLVLTNDLEIHAFQRHTSKSNTFVLLSPDERFYRFFSYGVILDIIETHLRDSTLYLKAKCRHRCKLLPHTKINHLLGNIYEVTVEIVREPPLTSPLIDTQFLALKRQHSIQSVDYCHLVATRKLRKYHMTQYPFPSWIYTNYEYSFLVEQLLTKLSEHYSRDLLPTDPVQLSYWFLQNYLLRHTERLQMLTVDSTVKRLRLELHCVTLERVICCAHCQEVIAQQSDVFIMSRDGAQSNYCNPGGHVFETVTVRVTVNVKSFGIPSARFSWFPGYSWSIAQCEVCNAHIGWCFTSSNLKPANFYGLAKNSCEVQIKDSDSCDTV